MVVAVALLFLFVYRLFTFLQLLNEAEYGKKNYADRGTCYPPRPKARRGLSLQPLSPRSA